jgi:hypothetical protein
VSSVVVSLLHSRRFLVQSRASLHLEIIALRHRLAVVDRFVVQNAYAERVIGSIRCECLTSSWLASVMRV